MVSAVTLPLVPSIASCCMSVRFCILPVVRYNLVQLLSFIPCAFGPLPRTFAFYMNGYPVAPLESLLRQPLYLVSATQNVTSANYWLRGTIWRPGLAPYSGAAGVWERSLLNTVLYCDGSRSVCSYGPSASGTMFCL